MKVLVAMSGGVDSSVAAARLLEAGHEVVGVTMKLWGGESDTGCCSVSDVDDARRVAQQLDIVHHVWAFTDDFEQRVVEPYVDAHRVGRTPNPCIECNRHLKFDRLLRRAVAVGFDAVATGHHARIVERPDGTRRLARGADPAKDQSYVLYVLDQSQLARTLLPVGELTKGQVRAEADRLGLRTAAKPDSQDVCFITSSAGRSGFLSRRLELHPAEVVDEAGRVMGRHEAVELVTLGQRRGLGLPGGGAPRYVVGVDVPRRRVRVGSAEELLVDEVHLHQVVWPAGHPPAASITGDSPGRSAASGLPAGSVSGDSPVGSAIGGLPAGLVSGGSPVGLAAGGLPAGSVSGGSPVGSVAGGLPAGSVTGGSAADSAVGASPAGSGAGSGSPSAPGAGAPAGPAAPSGSIEAIDGLLAQCSAHGDPRPATVIPEPGGRAVVRFARPERRVAPGQSVVLYEGDEVVAGGIVAD